jgi:hypothetical protein
MKKYKCSSCGEVTERDDLLAKKVLFTTMGEGARIKRSRVVGWLCPNCREKDPEWNRESSVGRAVGVIEHEQKQEVAAV